MPGIFVDPSDYDFTYRIAWSSPPDNRLYFFIRIWDNALNASLLDVGDWWKQDFLHISIDADHSGGWVLGRSTEEINNGQRYSMRVQPPPDLAFVQQSHMLEPHYSWSAGPEWFDAAWTVEPVEQGSVTYTMEFSCALWDEYGPTPEESVRYTFAAGQVIHLGPRATDSDSGGEHLFSAERYLPFRAGGHLHEDRDASKMADFMLIDSAFDYGSVIGQITYPDDGSPRFGAEVFLQDGIQRQRTRTDADGRYHFNGLPGSYEVYSSGAFSNRVKVEPAGGQTVKGVDFSSATERGTELADAGRLRRLLKAKPEIAHEPVLDHLGLLPPVYIAAMNGYLESLNLLLEHGADPNAEDRFGRTAMSRLAAAKLWHPAHSLMNRLVEHGATLDLTAALSMGKAERVKELVAGNGHWKVVQGVEASLFDGATLEGWQPLTDGWMVHDGQIVCPTSDRIQFMVSNHVVNEPFQLHFQVAAMERKPNDGKMVGIV